MYKLLYISRSLKLMNTAELEHILSRARQANHALGITGLLLYKDQSFMQLLEGPKGAVEALFVRISQDPRHFRLRMLVSRETDSRLCTSWSMGFRHADANRASELEGYSATLDKAFDFENPVEADRSLVELITLFRNKS